MTRHFAGSVVSSVSRVTTNVNNRFACFAVAPLFLLVCATELYAAPSVTANVEQAFVENETLSAGTGAFNTGYDQDSSAGENPTNVDFDLNQSFPQPGAIWKTSLPEGWFDWKRDLYKDRGIKLGFSYQSLYQTTSDAVLDEDTFWGGWALVEFKWDAINRGQDFEGGLVAALDWRHTIGDNGEPAFSLTASGSAWANDVPHISWDPWLAALYWEQKLRKEDNFVFRVGTQNAGAFIDFSRYKDPRVSFTGGPNTAGVDTLPLPAPGFGVSFRWNSDDPSEYYVAGTINDVNGDPQDAGLANWDTVDEGDFFYALELGKNWRRGVGDFDHLHVLFSYADDRSIPLLPVPDLPQEGGFGFKISGEKQWGTLVAFGSYGYNEAKGGPIAWTLMKQVVRGGLAFNRPLNINGEVGLGATWGQPLKGVPLIAAPQNDPLKDQYGLEMYWRMLVTNDLWVTPGIQIIWNPAYNSNTDAVVLPGLKFRFFL